MKRLINAIDQQSRQIICLTKELIDIPTVNPPGENYEQFVGFLKKRCEAVGLKTVCHQLPAAEAKKLGVQEGSARINLLARWDTGAKKTLHINSHYDVVPVTNNWKTDPFNAVVRKGKIFGRGSEDMKANIAAVISAVETLKRLGVKPAVNIELSFTPDEETGGAAGLEYLVRKNLVKADFGLGEGYEHDFIACGNKGMLWVELEVCGKSCHASAPYRGSNAFEAMVEVAGELKKFKTRLVSRKTKFAVREPRDAFSSLVCGGILSGGKKVNIVPDKCVFSVDIRLIPEIKTAEVLARIKKIIAGVERKRDGIKINLKILSREEAVITRKDAEFFSAFSGAVKQILKKGLKFAVMPGGTDLRFFIRKGVPCLGYTVRGENRAHADDEFVYCKSLIDTTKILAVFLGTFKPE